MMNKISFTKKMLNFRLVSYLDSLWLRVPLLDRWLIAELIPPLLFAVSAFTTISLTLGAMFELVREIVEKGLSLNIAVAVLFLRLPEFLVLSFPMAVLMATLLTYSKLSTNSEIKALLSIGIQPTRIISAALSIGIFMTIGTFLFNNIIVPNSNQLADITLRKGLGVAMHSYHSEDIVYSRKGKRGEGLTHLFYAKDFSGGEMKKVTLLDFTKPNYTQVLKSDKASWKDSLSSWEFINGNILTLAPNGSTVTLEFESYIYPLDSGPQKVAELPKDSNNMSLSDALKAQKLYKLSGNLKETRRMQVRIQEKFTLPMACFVFSLIGATLGIKPNIRTTKSQGFGLSIVLILIYYILSFTFSSLGVGGSLNPIIAAWSPVLISLFGGSILLRYIMK